MRIPFHRALKALGAAFCLCGALLCLWQGGVLERFTLARVERLRPQTLVTLAEAPHEGTLSLQTAAEADLARLPGIGAVTAARIIAYRDAVGGFVNMEELSRVTGIGEATLTRLRPLVCLCWEAHGGGDVIAGEGAPLGPDLVESGGTKEDPAIEHAPVRVNSATREELTLLPGIGEALAKAILEDRAQYGPYERLEDLLRVPGIGEKRLEAIRPYATAE